MLVPFLPSKWCSPRNENSMLLVCPVESYAVSQTDNPSRSISCNILLMFDLLPSCSQSRSEFALRVNVRGRFSKAAGVSDPAVVCLLCKLFYSLANSPSRSGRVSLRSLLTFQVLVVFCVLCVLWTLAHTVPKIQGILPRCTLNPNVGLGSEEILNSGTIALLVSHRLFGDVEADRSLWAVVSYGG